MASQTIKKAAILITFLALAIFVGTAAASPPDLIGHWKMNDDAATATVIDETGNHNGTYKDKDGNLDTDTGASTGKINGALDFDGPQSGGGTDEYIEIPDHDDYTPVLTPLSVSAWVYMHDAGNFRVITKGVYNTDGEWGFYTNSSKVLNFVAFDESVPSCKIGRTYNTSLASYENQWVHLVGTCSGGILSSAFKLYINGTQVDDTDNASGVFEAIENLNGPVWIGRYSTTYANGLIDDGMIFSTELSQYDVDILYNNGAGTEITAELDQQILPRRSNLSRDPFRRRYEN